MSGRALTLICIALLGFVGDRPVRALGVGQASAADQSHADGDLDRLLAEGKQIFVQKCARCHNERGDKPLATGAPLSARGLSATNIAQAVNGRLRDRTDAERQAVTLYISSLMQSSGSDQK